MIKHYITKYYEGDKRYVESWLQFNLFGVPLFCFSKRRIEI